MHAAIATDPDVLKAANDAYDRLAKDKDPAFLLVSGVSVSDYVSGAIGPDIGGPPASSWEKYGAWYHQTPPMRNIYGQTVIYDWVTWHDCWGEWFGSAMIDGALGPTGSRRQLSFALGWLVHNVSDQALDFSGGANQESERGTVATEGVNLNGTLLIRLCFERIAIDRYTRIDMTDNLTDNATAVGENPLRWRIEETLNQNLTKEWMNPEPDLLENLRPPPVEEQAKAYASYVGWIPTAAEDFFFLFDANWKLVGCVDNPLDVLTIVASGFADETLDQALCYYAWGEDTTGLGRPEELGARQRAVAALNFLGAPPRITSFQINSGALTTTSSDVYLNSNCQGYSTQYTATEDTHAVSWRDYPPSSIPSTLSAGNGTNPFILAAGNGTNQFTLSTGNGTKTVYFKVRNRFGESEWASDCILAAIPIYAPCTPASQPLETVSSLKPGIIGVCRTNLERCKQYYILAEGTYTVPPDQFRFGGGGYTADAEWIYEQGKWTERRGSTDEYWTDLQMMMSGHGDGEDWLGSPLPNPDPVHDFATFTPHTFSPSHRYWLPIVGAGCPSLWLTAAFGVPWYDISGGLTVHIYASVCPTGP